MSIVKITKTAISAAFLSLSIAHAGDMGGSPLSVFKPYFGAEASYNWIAIDKPSINSILGSSSAQNWGGRLYAGFLRHHTEKLGFTGELGGGYYGDQSINLPQLSSTQRNSVVGYDVLVGALYKFKKFDVFGKVGFMVENFRTRTKEQNLKLIEGDFFTGSYDVRSTNTQVLPEIRVGGIYNLRDDLGLTLSYMHAFGSTPSISGSMSSSQAAGINQTAVANLQNPSLDSVLLGLIYYFS
jgi:hypothetical protein